MTRGGCKGGQPDSRESGLGRRGERVQGRGGKRGVRRRERRGEKKEKRERTRSSSARGGDWEGLVDRGIERCDRQSQSMRLQRIGLVESKVTVDWQRTKLGVELDRKQETYRNFRGSKTDI